MICEGWSKFRFCDIVTLASGQVSPKEEPYSFMSHVGPENIESGTGRISGVQPAFERQLVSGKYMFDENAILYSKIRPNLNKVAKPGYAGICSADMYPVWGKSGVIDTDFLLHLMMSDRFVSEATSVSNRTGMPKINRRDLGAINVHLPPLSEQRKIAEILQIWDQSMHIAEALLANARKQKHALLRLLLTGPFRFPEFRERKWQEARLGDVADVLIGGTPARKESAYWGGGNTWLSISDLDSKYVGSSKENITDLGVQNSNVKLLPKNTVVMSFKLTIGKLGITKNPLFTNEAICGFIPKREDIFDPEFLYQVLHVVDVIIDAHQAVKGKTLNKPKLKNIVIPLPEIVEQRKISNFLLASDQDIENIEMQIEKLRMEKKALMQQLLSGKRRVVV